MEKVKKISKYVVNGLNMANMLILGLSQIYGWQLEKVSATIICVAGVISLYLVGGKLFDLKDEPASEEYDVEKGED
jgi:hypothetical protein